MKKVIFLTDFFADSVLGGAELSTEVVIDYLISRGYDIHKVRCHEFSQDMLREKIVITNFANLSEYNKKLISLSSDYIIIERDQKYVRTRNLTAYTDFIAPKSEIINKEFYRNAKSVLCLTNKHTELTTINLELDNIVNIGSTQFSEKQLQMIESNITDEKNGKYAIVEGKLHEKAILFCQKNNIDYELITNREYPKLIKSLSKYTGLVFFSHHFESYCRLLVEAKILGLKILTDDRNGCTYEPWFKISQGKNLSKIIRENVVNSIDIIDNEISKLFEKTLGKVLFLATFNPGSTNISQLESLKKIGYSVHGYDYREDLQNTNSLLQNIVGLDVLLIAKGNTISNASILEFKKNNNCKAIYWFPDAICNYTAEMKTRAEVCDISIFDKKNVLELDNKESYHWVCEGFDDNVDYICDEEKEFDVSFIGDVSNWPHRQRMLANILDLKIVTDAYGTDHAKMVSKTKINLNVCTDDSASDRVYKVLAAGGFLLTDDWYGRELTGLVDGEDLVIYKNNKDLVDKIKFYLDNPDECNRISKNGNITVKKLNRLNWAKNIANHFSLS